MDVAKWIGIGLGWVGTLPLLVLYGLHALLLDRPRALIATAEWAGCVPGHLGIYVRQACYRCLLGAVGRDVHFGFLSLFSKSEARVGDRVYIGRFCTIGWADLGDDVMLADAVQVLSGRHQHGGQRTGTAMRENPRHFEKVTIGRGAWLGAGAIVMADVGENAIVAAGAVVTEPVAPGARVGGVPARTLGRGGEALAFT